MPVIPSPRLRALYLYMQLMQIRRDRTDSHCSPGCFGTPAGLTTGSQCSKMARQPHSQPTISDQTLHVSGTYSLQFLCGEDTATALKLDDFRTISAQPLYGFASACHLRARTVHNVNKYAIACSLNSSSWLPTGSQWWLLQFIQHIAEC